LALHADCLARHKARILFILSILSRFAYKVSNFPT